MASTLRRTASQALGNCKELFFKVFLIQLFTRQSIPLAQGFGRMPSMSLSAGARPCCNEPRSTLSAPCPQCRPLRPRVQLGAVRVFPLLSSRMEIGLVVALSCGAQQAAVRARPRMTHCAHCAVQIGWSTATLRGINCAGTQACQPCLQPAWPGHGSTDRRRPMQRTAATKSCCHPAGPACPSSVCSLCRAPRKFVLLLLFQSSNAPLRGPVIR